MLSGRRTVVVIGGEHLLRRTPDPAAAPVADLVRAVDIPYQQFTLKNGLRVVVHTDRKAPVVALHAWYNVGSKDEPAGQPADAKDTE